MGRLRWTTSLGLAGAALLGVPGEASSGESLRGLCKPSDPVALEVRVMDGVTGGTVVPGGVSIRHRAGSAASAHRVLRAVGDTFVIEDSGLLRGHRPAFDLDLDLPEGWVRPRERALVGDDDVTRFTRRVVRTVVVWPELRLRVAVRDGNSMPVAGARVRALRTGSRQVDWFTDRNGRAGDVWVPLDEQEVVTNSRGIARLHGLPAVPGAPYRIEASVGDRLVAVEDIEVRRPWDARVVTLVAGDDPGPAPFRREGPWGAIRCFGDARKAESGDACLTVLVRCEDGTSAKDVEVVMEGAPAEDGPRPWRQVARTDAEGRAEFGALPPGKARVRVREPGLVLDGPVPIVLHPAPPKRIRPGLHTRKWSTLVVREARGRSVEVFVVDRAGRPVPGARIESRGFPSDYVPVDARGVQALDLITNGRGRIVLPRVGRPGLDGRMIPIRMEAMFGHRAARFALEGDAVTVTLPD